MVYARSRGRPTVIRRYEPSEGEVKPEERQALGYILYVQLPIQVPGESRPFICILGDAGADEGRVKGVATSKGVPGSLEKKSL